VDDQHEPGGFFESAIALKLLVSPEDVHLLYTLRGKSSTDFPAQRRATKQKAAAPQPGITESPLLA
jgi:hypothetical protein